MKLHWRTYRNEYFWERLRDWDWLPMIRYRQFTVKHYPKEINIDFLKWGFAVRWWWQ